MDTKRIGIFGLGLAALLVAGFFLGNSNTQAHVSPLPGTFFFDLLPGDAQSQSFRDGEVKFAFCTGAGQDWDWGGGWTLTSAKNAALKWDDSLYYASTGMKVHYYGTVNAWVCNPVWVPNANYFVRSLASGSGMCGSGDLACWVFIGSYQDADNYHDESSLEDYRQYTYTKIDFVEDNLHTLSSKHKVQLVLHEFGHTFSLDHAHTCSDDTVMRPICEVPVDYITWHDILTVGFSHHWCHYGENPACSPNQ